MKYLSFLIFVLVTLSCVNKEVCKNYDNLDSIVDTLHLKRDFKINHQNLEKTAVFAKLNFSKRDTAISSLFNSQKCGSDLMWTYLVDSTEWTFFLRRNEKRFELTSLTDVASITTIHIDPNAKYHVLYFEHKIDNKFAPKEIYMKNFQLYMVRDTDGKLWYRP
jgi:hypothetical protein